MQQATINALLNNAALLVILSIIYELTYHVFPQPRMKQAANGILVALTCIAVMSVPFTLIPGVMFDTRSILISVTALIFGTVPAIITIIPAMIFRILHGGIGTLPGITIILTSALLGSIWRRWLLPKAKKKLRWLYVYFMGMAVHIMMIASLFLIPYPDSVKVIREVALPVITIFPLATVLLYLLLGKQQAFWQMRDELKQSEERYRLLYDEQKKSVQELKQSELKYHQLFETMTQGVVCQGADGRIISANPEAERILGLTLDQMMGKTSMDPNWKTICEDGTEMPGSEHPSMVALRTRKPCGPVILGVFQPKLNSHVWISVNATPILEEDGSLSHVYTIFQDITAEKKAKHDYQLLFNSMVDGFALHEIICDENGNPSDYRFLAVNPAFEQIIGKRASDIIGRTVTEVMPGIEDYWIETYGRVALTGESVMFENYDSVTDKYFRVIAYQPAPMQFACTFSDDTQRVRAEKELFRTLARLRGLLDNSNSPVIVFDDKGVIAEISAAAEKITGLSRNEARGRNMGQLGLAGILKRALQITIAGTKPGEETAHPARKASWTADAAAADRRITEGIDVFELDGERRFFESRLFTIETENEKEKLFGYLAIDVTDRIMAEQALKESEEKYSSYIENAPYAVVVVDENGNYMECNKAASSITGYSKEELLGMNIRDITAGESLEEAMRHFQSLLDTGRMSAELKYIHKNGVTRWWTVDAVKISDRRFIGFSIDITDRRQAEEDLINMSKIDYLTGIYNRRFFETELKRLDKEMILPLSVIIGDINGVKFINDTFGHAAGDKHIVEIATILRACCREGDILARTGGDEFCILMPKTDNSTANEVLNRIQTAVAKFDQTNAGDTYQHSLSLGCATKVSADEDIKEIIKIAEGYMYQHKLLEHNSIHSTIVASIKATMFEKSHETEEHAQRLVTLSKAIGTAIGLSQAELDKLELLASLHDIGKVGIRDEILTKPDKLNDMEWEEIKRHPEIGYRIAKATSELAPIAEGILCHHERWDGLGYPQGLCGESIPLISRIVSVVDAYDAMTNDRPYRKALDQETALEQIMRNAGTQFDPHIAGIFTKILAKQTTHTF